MYHDLNNRVAVITGAGRGIGRACALRLNQEGCRLVLNDIDAAGLEETRTLLDTPEHALGLAADIGAPQTADQLSALALRSFSELHICINNAALVRWGPVVDCPDEDWEAVFRVTLDGAFYGIRSAIKAMRANRGPIATPPMLAAAAQAPGGVAGWESQTVPGRMGHPEEIASAVSFLVSSQASYINGATLSVDGGVSARTNSPRFS